MTHITDADSLVFSTCCAAEEVNPFNPELKTSSLKVCIKMFDAKMKFMKIRMKTDNLNMFVSGDNNFRYDIFAEYKANRAEGVRPLFLSELKQHAIDNHGATASHGAEADDYVVYYANKFPDAVVLAIDKDVKNQVTNKVYDYWKEEYEQVDREHVDNFPFFQTITGDSGDGIIGITGPATARAFLYEYSWEAVVGAYKGIIPPNHSGKPFYKKNGEETKAIIKIRDKNLTEEDALMNMRLVRLDQFNPETMTLNLWNPPII